MSTLREAAEKALETLTDSRIGRCDYMDGVEIYSDFNDAAEALRAELVKPDAPTVEDEPAPQMPEALRDSLQRRCVEWGVYWRAPDAHGVDLTHEQALELLRDALGVEVEIAAAPRPAPAEPQPAAQQEQAGERKPLTDEQVFASEDFMSANGLYWGLPMTTLIQIVRCTERAHGITATKGER